MPDIRKIPKTDLIQFSELGSSAFPGMGIHTEKQIKDLTERLKIRYDAEHVNFWGIYKQKKLAGGIVFYDFTMNLFGQRVLCGGGGFLVVSLLHKKEHIARDLCRFFFKQYRKQNAPFAALYPFSPSFYRKMGVGYGAKARVYNLIPKLLPDNGSKKYLRKLTKNDIPKIMECFDAYADQKTGMFYDIKDYRESFFRQNEASKFYGYERDGKLLGYFVLNFEKESQSNFLRYKSRIVEMVYLNRDVLNSFMTFFHSQKDQIDSIQYLTFDDNFHFLPEDPRNGSGSIYPSVFHKTDISTLGIMYRILHPKQMFETLKTYSFNRETIRLKIDIKDSFLKENNKPIVVYFANGFPTVKPATSRTDVTLTIDIAELASLVLGAVDLKSLYMYKRCKLSNEQYLDQLFRLFRTNHKPECLTHF